MKREKVILSILFSAFVFSSIEVSGKLISGQLNAFQVTFVRFLIGALLLFPFAIRDIKRKKLVLKKTIFVSVA
ncbi:EamA family transporter [Caloramator sp. Dgby_cultured_2]|uniref:EamA family transporter n=1 Tax=Caloramator sp. Dgby_cultured_2 TaxID=3029174 RepID=UPI00237DAAAD|nr:EamA family transporter [Caloramator sp. Dgby_cultured_2]WDU83016.1 EamA family transporter [Caloramator sp. Dgby_cultured_2]